MKNLILLLTLIPLIAFSHDYEFKDNQGREVESFIFVDEDIVIKDNRGRRTGYIRDGKLYDNRGRKQGEYVRDNSYE